MELKRFSEINLTDPFFDTLKSDYAEFSTWFNKKSKDGSSSYVDYDNANHLQGFLYVKVENEELSDITPVLPKKKRLKVGTFKIDAHGSNRGQRFIKKIVDIAVTEGAEEIYLTIFPKHLGLIKLIERFGFRLSDSSKESSNGTEAVYIKPLKENQKADILNYPIIWDATNRDKHILAIHPIYHPKLFPDSLLNNEQYDLIQDVSHTNSIYKIYVTSMDGVRNFKPGDIIIIYRTNDHQGSAEYRSVITSVCLMVELKLASDFKTVEEYITYCRPFSVFSEDELRGFYKKYKFVIKMTYNIALTKRLIRKKLIEECGFLRDIYWGVVPVNNEQFDKILQLGEVNESFIVD